MFGNSGSEFGTFVSGAKRLSGVALTEAVRWADALMDAEHRGRGDREKSIVGRVSKRTGVPESYLRRLKYKSHEMKDVAGSVYRALMVAYDDLCQRNEDAADRMRDERLMMRGQNETADKEPGEKGLGSDETVAGEKD